MDDELRLCASGSDRQVFFIGGSPKSGTTWLQLLLDRHPEVACAGETHFLDQFVPNVGKAITDHQAYVEWVNESVFTDLNCCPSLGGGQLIALLSYAFVLMLEPKIDGKRIKAMGEKTPDNIDNLPVMTRMFPDSKFIQIVRDGRDCAVSGWHHNKRLATAWDAAVNLRDYALNFARRWSDHLDIGEEFALTYPARFHRVKYEDLSACPVETLRGLLDFLAVDSSGDVVTACVDGASFESLTGRRRGQADAKSFFRKGATGDWRNHFDQPTERAFLEIAGPWLDRLGYGEVPSVV